MGIGFLFQNLQANGVSVTSSFLLKYQNVSSSRVRLTSTMSDVIYLFLLESDLLKRSVAAALWPQKKRKVTRQVANLETSISPQ